MEELPNLTPQTMPRLPELAERIGSSASTISYYELGNRTPSVDLLVDLAHALRTDPNSLLGFKVRP